MTDSHVSVDIEGKVGCLTIDFPPANSLTPEVRVELEEALEELAQKKEVWSVILTGGGAKFFMAGANIQSLLSLDRRQAFERVRAARQFMEAICRLKKPVIAAINGACLGGGLEVALCCDIRIAADHAVFGFPEVSIGLMPGAGGTQRLPRIISPGLARYLILTGYRLSADQAYKAGLVEKVVPGSELRMQVLTLARRINQQAPLAVRNAKEAMNAYFERSLHEGLDLENDLWAQLFETKDKKEGTLAFLEKRKPVFEGI